MEITGCKMLWLDSQTLAEHYHHLLNKPFHPEVEAFMQSSPVLALTLTGDDAVGKVCALAGAPNPTKAVAGTIRADFGTDVMASAIHTSDSPEAAEAELTRFFARTSNVAEKATEGV
jgi:nucleoside-diphosphate kinase